MVPPLVEKILRSDGLTMEELLERKGSIYTFLNPVSYLNAQKEKDLFQAFDGIFADGSLLVKAIRLLYGRKVMRRSFDMTSLAPVLLRYALQEGKRVAIIASKQEEVEQAVEIIRDQYPGIDITYWRNGYFSSATEIEAEARHIAGIAPDYLIVGMGIVLQEKMLLCAKKEGFEGIGFTCGGFIHQLCGGKDYYPAWIDSHNLRFVYRMYKEPHTRSRYAKAAIIFPPVFTGERITHLFKKTPSL